MPLISRVIVAAGLAEVREDVAAYLGTAGFTVQACALPPDPPPAMASLVWLTDLDAAVPAIERTLNAWLSPNSRRRAVVVTWRPLLLREAARRLGDRLVVLAAPVFGWSVVDALRAEPPRGDRHR